jgi:hypothetical protein
MPHVLDSADRLNHSEHAIIDADVNMRYASKSSVEPAPNAADLEQTTDMFHDLSSFVPSYALTIRTYYYHVRFHSYLLL